MKAKKSFGQHFLRDESISRRIADLLQPKGRYAKVLEIGPGQGMLTQFLLPKEYELVVVEADRDMIPILQRNFPELKGQIITGDFLRQDLPLFFPKGEAFAIIGNFPYNISSQILFKMLDHREQVPELVGMFQKEMAERVVAAPGSKIYGVISILVQAYYEGEYCFTVDRTAFDPPPKVQSAVIHLRRKAEQDLGCDHKLFRRVVKQAFSQRRKMLRNTMKGFVKGHSMLTEDFFMQRPERLSVEDFIELTNRLQEAIHKDVD
ncbi:MAG: 16S rRNA (adenine(1518)-N(6)/adenine(1519)-N(6))-dimethyltransferase RsmA [Bacteroidota bacterium]